MASLRRFAAGLRESCGAPVPDADPFDGGGEARLLLLLETPGPRIGLTGFVSCDNPSMTARNLRGFLAAAAIPREAVLIWNTVPWVIHAPGAVNRAPRRAEIAGGLRLLDPLLALLPRLEVAVLAGRVAGEAREPLARLRPGLAVLAMPHPSPTYVVTSPEIPLRIMATLRAAAERLRAAGG